MAVGAGFRVVGEIRVSLGVNKGITPETSENTYSQAEYDCDCSAFHQMYPAQKFTSSMETFNGVMQSTSQARSFGWEDDQ
jgi:hypothetical protein